MTTLCLLSLSSYIPVWDYLPPFTYNHIFCILITVPQRFNAQKEYFSAP